MSPRPACCHWRAAALTASSKINIQLGTLLCQYGSSGGSVSWAGRYSRRSVRQAPAASPGHHSAPAAPPAQHQPLNIAGLAELPAGKVSTECFIRGWLGLQLVAAVRRHCASCRPRLPACGMDLLADQSLVCPVQCRPRHRRSCQMAPPQLSLGKAVQQCSGGGVALPDSPGATVVQFSPPVATLHCYPLISGFSWPHWYYHKRHNNCRAVVSHHHGL